MDYLLVNLLQSFLDLRDVDIFPPGFLALSRRLLVLLRRIGRTRKRFYDGHDGEPLERSIEDCRSLLRIKVPMFRFSCLESKRVVVVGNFGKKSLVHSFGSPDPPFLAV